MPTLKVKVEMNCKTCNQKFYSTVPDEIHYQLDHPNVKPVTITIEELRGSVTKDLKDNSGNVIGSLDLKDFTFDITHPRCNGANKYSVNDFTFLPS